MLSASNECAEIMLKATFAVQQVSLSRRPGLPSTRRSLQTMRVALRAERGMTCASLALARDTTGACGFGQEGFGDEFEQHSCRGAERDARLGKPCASPRRGRAARASPIAARPQAEDRAASSSRMAGGSQCPRVAHD